MSVATRALETTKAILRPVRNLLEDVWLKGVLAWRWKRRSRLTQARHGFGAPLVITLTSFPPRFPTLHLTLRSLLTQTVRPDHVILWIAEADLTKLPAEVLYLRSAGLEIRPCEDLRSYKKIVPALNAFPEAFLVTADDDIYYWPNWLGELTHAQSTAAELPCHRAHRIRRDQNAAPTRYLSWEQNIAAAAGPDIFPTTGHGVLYPPGTFNSRVTDVATFEAICPTGDDIWLFGMAQLASRQFRKVGPRRRFHEWRGTQKQSLYSNNGVGSGNDRQIAAMRTHFGLP